MVKRIVEEKFAAIKEERIVCSTQLRFVSLRKQYIALNKAKLERFPLELVTQCVCLLPQFRNLSSYDDDDNDNGVCECV